MPNAQRKKKSICRIYEDVVQQNEILVSYLAKRQNATPDEQPAERDLGPYPWTRAASSGSHEPLERIASRGAWLTVRRQFRR